MKWTKTLGLVVAIGLVSLGTLAQSDYAGESARDIPVAYEVDVVVVGGSSGAVTAAVEAAKAGADVFLAASRPYLGEDICGSYRLWLEPDEKPVSPLARRMFKEPDLPPIMGPSLPFTYVADCAADPMHPDRENAPVLSDGKMRSAYNESVQYNGDVQLTLDLGARTALGRLHVMAFQRRADIELQDVVVSLSDDGQTWRKGPVVKNGLLGQGEFIDSSLQLTAQLSGEARYLRLLARKTPQVERILLAEVVVEPPAKEEAAPQSEYRLPPTPMQVKRELDQALLDAGVDFLYASYVTDVLRDEQGRLAGIVMANRSGRQAVTAKVIIDATPRASVARLAGVPFRPYPSGPQTFTRVVLGGDVREGAGIQGRVLPAPIVLTQGGQTTAQAVEYTLTIPMADGSFGSFAKAEQTARDMTWDPGQMGASDMLFQVPPDAMSARASAAGPFPGVDSVDVDAFRPKGEDNLYILGGCADMMREAAAQLLRPLTFMDMGSRIGQVAAQSAGIQPKPVVVCFGDSITAGYYPKKLERMLPGVRVVNAGKGGHTSAQGLARIKEDVLDYSPEAVVVLFGTNDSCLREAGQYKCPLDQYESNLREIVTQCRAKGADVFLCNIPPIVAEPYHGRHPEEYYTPEGGLQAILARYRDAVRRVGDSMNVPIVALDAELAKDMSSISPDGVHPTPKGERMIAECVAEVVRPALPPAKASSAAACRVAVSHGNATVSGDVGESLTGIHPHQAELPSIVSEERTIPVLGKYDVVVVGGGTGGAPAGISAARAGAKTLVLEYLYGLGGVGTLGLIGKYYHGYREGFTAEIDEGVIGMGPKEDALPKGGWNVEWKMEWFRTELLKAGGDLWYGTLGCGAFVEGNRVKGVVVATPDGRGVILADAVIDSTGSSDVAIAAGADSIYTDGSHVAVQGTGMPPRKPGAGYTNTDYTLTDDSNVVDIWRTFVVAKGKYEQAFDLGQIIDTRERRRIVGDFVISPVDLYYRRTYTDTIGLSESNFDSHGYTVHPFFALKAPDKVDVIGYTPYRALLPKGYDGILVTGLGISAHRDAMPILRMQPDIQNQGYAAGQAAAMAVSSGKSLRDIDIKALQRHLVAKGCVPESVLTDVDAMPTSDQDIADAVHAAGNDYEGVGLLLARPDAALPLLRGAYSVAEDAGEKLIYAHILGMMGDPAGADQLLKAVSETDWDQGWSFTGMGQFGMSLSPVDSYMVALGKTGDMRAVAPIIGKARQLDATSEFSHHRAVAMAFEELESPEAAPVLAELLSKPGMRGHAYLDIEDAQRGALSSDPNAERNRSLRELILARALYRCGDYEGLGEKILKEYANDFRGHHARHARAVLAGN